MESYKKQSYKKYICLKKCDWLPAISDHLRSNHLRSKYIFLSFVYNIKMLNLLLNELKAIAKIRGIKGYKNMSEERLLSSFTEF